MAKEKIYLAIPYTWNAAKSFEIANKVAAHYMSLGHPVFSPISHSHSIADHLDESLRYDQDFWMAQDLPLVEWCDEIVVVCIGEYGGDLIANSKGVRKEIESAQALGKKIEIYQYYD